MGMALGGYRTLDLTQQGFLICGKILADLGCDVIKVEKPGGDPSRNIGPFYKGMPHPERSLFWFACNTNKRSVTLDIETADGRDIFKKLAKTADFVIESYSPGYLDGLGLGYAVLSETNPRIIVTSITPYGSTGPKAHFKSCDLTTWASSGILYVNGDPCRPPNWISFPQAFLHAGAEGAVASLIAHWHRELTGEGQHVDVSAQQCLIPTTMNAVPMWDLNRYNYRRSSSAWTVAKTGVKIRWVFPCKDGYISYTVRGGGASFHVVSIRALLQWMAEEGMAPDWLVNFDWVNDYDVMRITQEQVDRLEAPFAQFFMTKTKAEIFDNALKRGIVLAPVNNLQDICDDPQLQDRHYWVDIEHPELGDTLTYCGAFVQMSETPWSIRQPAPRIGEHNIEIYTQELGLSEEEVSLLKQAGVI